MAPGRAESARPGVTEVADRESPPGRPGASRRGRGRGGCRGCARRDRRITGRRPATRRFAPEVPIRRTGRNGRVGVPEATGGEGRARSPAKSATRGGRPSPRTLEAGGAATSMSPRNRYAIPRFSVAQHASPRLGLPRGMDCNARLRRTAASMLREMTVRESPPLALALHVMRESGLSRWSRGRPQSAGRTLRSRGPEGATRTVRLTLCEGWPPASWMRRFPHWRCVSARG